MRYLLDSNIIIRALTATGEALRQRIGQCDEGEVVTSAITFAEIALGSAKGKPPGADELVGFLSEIPVLDFDLEAAKAYASLPFKRASFDRLIAAHALSRRLAVVTDNVAHFADVPGLTVENWSDF